MKKISFYLRATRCAIGREWLIGRLYKLQGVKWMMNNTEKVQEIEDIVFPFPEEDE